MVDITVPLRSASGVLSCWIGLDLAFPQQRVAVEVDGWAWHHEINRFRHDRRRQNAVVLAAVYLA